MPKEIAIGRLRAFHRTTLARGYDRMELSLYGGEPLLNLRGLRGVLTEVARLSGTGLEVTPIVNTNGTLVSRKTAEYFAQTKTRIHISLDGPDEDTNAYRVDRRGKSSWAAAMRGLDCLKEAGCPTQLNVVVTPLNVDHLTSLVSFARDKGCDQIFLSLPDGEPCIPDDDIETLAGRLVKVASVADREGLKIYGPWAIGFRQTFRESQWPPLNVIVGTTGEVWFPQFPHRKMPSVENALQGNTLGELENEWKQTLKSCDGCDLLDRCNGYIQMMVRYHTGSSAGADRQCQLARKIISISGRGQAEVLRTAIELRIRPITEDEIAISLPLWLEEGLCEHLSGISLDLSDLFEARPYIDAFIRFVADCSDTDHEKLHHSTGMLAFSHKPVDQNPGYRLAHDFVGYIHRQIGLKAYLQEVRQAGLMVLLTPFPTPGSRIEMLRYPLVDLMAKWRKDLLERTRPQYHFPKPLRVMAAGNRILIFNRIVGGFMIRKAPSSEKLGRLTDLNVDLADVSHLIEKTPENEAIINRWCHAVFARRVGYHLRLSLDDGCNLACTYCYETNKTLRPMSVATADRAVAAWRNLLRASDNTSSSIRLFGGEPFLNWKVMKHILDTATTGLPDGSIQWLINTNGTLIRAEHLDTLRQKGNRLLVLLSCDGVGNVHDRMRKFRDGRGTFERMDQAAHLLAAAHIPICLSATLSVSNGDGLDALVDYVAALRDQYGESISLALKPIILPNPADGGTQQTERQLFQAIDRCDALSVPIHGEMFRALDILLNDATPTGHFCAVNGGEISVNARGDLLLCHAIPDSIYASLDDLTNADVIPIPDRIKDRIPGNLEGCSGCVVEGLCSGGCMAQSVAAAGNTHAKPGDFFCGLIRNTFYRSIERLLARNQSVGHRPCSGGARPGHTR